MIYQKKNQNNFKKNLLSLELIIQKFKYYMKVANMKDPVAIMNCRVDKVN